MWYIAYIRGNSPLLCALCFRKDHFLYVHNVEQKLGLELCSTSEDKDSPQYGLLLTRLLLLKSCSSTVVVDDFKFRSHQVRKYCRANDQGIGINGNCSPPPPSKGDL